MNENEAGRETEDEEGTESRAWIPDAAIESLSMERQMHAQESDMELTRRMFRENSPTAANAIVHIALYSPNEKARLDAAKYVIERVLGKPGEENPHGRTPLEALMEGVLTQVEDYANGDQPQQ